MPLFSATFNLKNVNLLTKSNINRKNGVTYEKNVYIQNKHKRKKTKTKSVKPKLLKTIDMNQF